MNGAALPQAPTDGLVVVDKEPGWTSHDVVARCRRIFGQRRVGHAGTLDPDATGVLLVGLGRATRLLRFLSALEKTYTAEVVLGVATSTLDASGDVTARFDMGAVTLAGARAAARALTGDIEQVPPMVSAVKVGGQRLHVLARQGTEIERAPRPVHVARFEVDEGPEPGILAVEVDCSSGTYVRTLAADLGVLLGGGAHLRNLRRTRVGTFTESEAAPLAAVQAGVEAAAGGAAATGIPASDGHPPTAVLTPAQALRHLDRLSVSDEVAVLIGRGNPLPRAAVGARGSGPWSMVDGRGRLLAVYQDTETDRIRPAVVLAG